MHLKQNSTKIKAPKVTQIPALPLTLGKAMPQAQVQFSSSTK